MLSSKLFKPIVILSAISVLVIAIFCLISLYDYYYPELNNDAVQFFIKDKQHVPEHENSVYSIIGLNAPNDVDDIHQFGVELVNNTLSNALDFDKKHFSLRTRLLEVDNELTFEGDINKIICWLDETYISGSNLSNDNKCYTEKELRLVVDKNHIVLKRHEELKKYTKYDDNLLFATNGQLLINAHRLFLANIRLNLEAGNEEILSLLINDLKYFRVLMRQPATMVTKAINMVLYNLSLTQLEYAITQHTNIAQKYKTELDDALSEISIEEFNLDGVLREEFELINSVFCIDESLGIETFNLCEPGIDKVSTSTNFIINDFYDFYLDYKYILSLDKDQMVKECNIHSGGYQANNYLRILLHMPVFKTHMTYILLKDGIVKGCALMEPHKSFMIRHNELRAYLDSSW